MPRCWENGRTGTSAGETGAGAGAMAVGGMVAGEMAAGETAGTMAAGIMAAGTTGTISGTTGNRGVCAGARDGNIPRCCAANSHRGAAADAFLQHQL